MIAQNLPDTEEFTSSGSQRDIRAVKVVHMRFGQHGVILNF